MVQGYERVVAVLASQACAFSEVTVEREGLRAEPSTCRSQNLTGSRSRLTCAAHLISLQQYPNKRVSNNHVQHVRPACEQGSAVLRGGRPRVAAPCSVVLSSVLAPPTVNPPSVTELVYPDAFQS